MVPVSKVRGLKCRECARGYPVSPAHVCEFCFGAPEVDYDYEAIQKAVSRDRIAAGPASIWRYQDLLPLDGEPPVGHHVGFTPGNLANSVAAHGPSPVPTRMYAAQAEGCGPIVTMIKRDSDVLVPVRPKTIAKSLAIGNPADGYYAYRVVKESGGAAEHATDEEILDAMELLARTEGIFTETAGGGGRVTGAATRKLIEQGRIPRDEPIVVCITGNGLKTVEAMEGRLREAVRIRPSLAAFDRALADLKTTTPA